MHRRVDNLQDGGETRASDSGESLPETWWCVVQGVHFSLHLVVQDTGALFQSVTQQVLSHDDHGDAGTAHILLSAGKDEPELQIAGKHNKYSLINAASPTTAVSTRGTKKKKGINRGFFFYSKKLINPV